MSMQANFTFQMLLLRGYSRYEALTYVVDRYKLALTVSEIEAIINT